MALGEGGFGGLTAAYGWAHFGKSLFWYASELLFAFFLTEVGGLSGRRMGLVLALGLVASVAIDLVLAWTLRRSLSDVKRAGRLQVLGAALSAVAACALFMTPWIVGSAKFAFAMGAMVAFRLSYALYDLPQNVLLALATDSERGRTQTATLRLFFSGLATLAVSALAAMVLAAPDLQTRARAFLWSVAAISLFAVATAWWLRTALAGLTFGGPPGAGPRAPQAPASRPASLALLLAATFVVSLTASLFTKLEPYFAAYVLKSALWGGAIITATAVGTTLSQPIWARLSERWRRPLVFGLAAALLIVGAVAFLGTVTRWVWIALAAAFAVGSASGGLGAIMWAAFGDLVATGAKQTGGLAFALFTGASKLALAVSGLGLGLFLQQIDYRGRDGEWVLVAMTLWPALGGAICLGLSWIWMRRQSRQIDAKSAIRLPGASPA